MARTLIVLDPNLRNLLGHYFEYDRSVAEAAILKGLECIILSHREAVLPPGLSFAVHPVYSADIWRTLPGEKYHSESNITAVSAAFASETLDFLGSWPLNQGDILFLPTITQAQLPGAAALAEALGPRGVRLCIMLRYQRTFYDGPTAVQAFRRLEESANKSSIILCTDSHRLARNLSALTTLPIEVFPIPHTDRLASERQSPSEPPTAVHFVSLGNARGEKGLAEIMKAIRKSTHEPWATRVRFTLQCNDPSADVVSAIASFRKHPDPRVTLIDRILNSKEYYALLQESDVVLTPYHRSIYGERTSGVFLEAVTAGKIVVCTRNTWMNDLLDIHGGGITVADRSTTDLCSAFGEIITNLSSLQERATTAADHWKKIHSPDNLVAHLLSDFSNPALVGGRTRAAVIFPWGNAVEGNSGAAVRLKLLVRYLEHRYGEVRVLFMAVGDKGGMLGDRTPAEPYYHMRIRARVLHAGLELLSRMLGGKKGQSFHLWFHLWPWIDGRFRARCAEIVRWADDVYLEYGYFAPLVGQLCQQYNKCLVVTQHDIVSEQSKGVPLIYHATQKLELRALRRAPRLVLCTEDERTRLSARGIAAELIPHPVDVESRSFPSAEDSALVLNALYAIPTNGRQICLFIGSAYEPNRQAAQFIRAIATRMRCDPRASNLVFVVAGACMEPEHDNNFIALGKIEEAGLSACYDVAAMVLVPVLEGTGSAVKSIEALARGAAILSTSVGMRGIPVEPGRQCLVQDDLSSYPERILEVLSDHRAASRLRMEAKSFGAGYDYRVLFARYGLSSSNGNAPVAHFSDMENNRRKAILELLPRMQQLKDSTFRQRLRDRFGLTEQDLPTLVEPEQRERNEINPTTSGQIVTEPESESVRESRKSEPAINTEAPIAPPAKRSMLRYIVKQALLLLPPVRLLYQEVLLANARSAELLRAITREEARVSFLEGLLRESKDHNARLEADRLRAEEERAAREVRFVERTAGLEELLRQASGRNSQLETDRTRTEEERAAREVRFLERTAGLEELLRQARARNVRLEADRGSTGEPQALHGADCGGREGTEVLISGGSGQPNYGDEKIAISVGKFHKRRGNPLWVNSFNPSIAVGCFSLAGFGASRVRNIDYLWASISPGKIDSIGSAIKCGLTLFDSEFEGSARHFLDLLGTVKTAHFHGGGYLNSNWPHGAFQIGAGLAMKKKFGTRLVATGIGLMPLNEADRAALAEAAAAFDGFECRDRESADALTSCGAKVEAGVDDVFLEVQASPLAPGAVPDLHLCLQFGEWDKTRQEKNLNRLVPFLKNNLNEIGSIVWWEFCPKSDLHLLDHPSLREIKDRVVVRRFGELMRSGLRARIGDLAIVSRFHAHLLLLRAGVRGILIVEDGLNFGSDYYQTKHQSLLDTGSNWLFLDRIERFDIGAFAPIPNWEEFNAQNERKKRECYERLFLDTL